MKEYKLEDVLSLLVECASLLASMSFAPRNNGYGEIDALIEALNLSKEKLSTIKELDKSGKERLSKKLQSMIDTLKSLKRKNND